MKLKKIATVIILIFTAIFAYSFYVDENGKKIPVSQNQANLIDDLEIKEGEALSHKQIVDIVNDSGSGLEEL